jgi:parallel beta helix pectate lyase-like protein
MRYPKALGRPSHRISANLKEDSMKARRVFAGLCVWVLSMVAASPALALANRVFVSARSGNNANSCDNIATPCQSFAGAVLQLNPGGEAIVLDSGGYGPVTITQAVTIEAPTGVTAFVHPPSGDAITVNAGASDKVVLRGLVLNGGSGIGIRVNTVGTLIVENCSISGFAGVGIDVLILPSATSSRLTVENTSITNNQFGIIVQNGDGTAATSTVLVSLDHVHLDHNVGSGLANAPNGSGAVSNVTVTNSTANHNGNAGFRSEDHSGGLDHLTLEHCVASNNAFDGVDTITGNAGGTLRLSNCTITDNIVAGVTKLISGTIFTRGDNTITGNGTDVTPAMTSFTAQ